MLVDSHAHLDQEAFGDDLSAVMERCRAAGVGRVVNVVSPFEPPRLHAVKRAAADAGIALHVAAGVHPHDASRWDAAVERDLEARMEEAVAWGEIGLDFHYMHSSREEQRRAFERQLALARKHGKPVVIHTREADDETAAILADASAQEIGGVIHCFTGGEKLAEAALAMGLHLSFSGIVSFKNAGAIREVAKAAPADRILIETDSPYLAPIPHRGRRNEPAFVVRVAEVLAAERSERLEDVVTNTWNNTMRLFNLV